MNTEKKKPKRTQVRRYVHCVTVYVSKPMQKALLKEASRRGVTMATVVRDAIDIAFQTQEAES